MNVTSLGRLDRIFVVRWLARGLSAALLLFWGAFFVEHLQWFANPAALPAWVYALQTLHLAMLVGLALGWRWELAGALLLMASSIPFFWFAAGPNVAWYTLVTVLPAALWLACIGMDWQRGRA